MNRHALNPGRSHARPGLRERLTDLLRGHGETLDPEDDGDDLTEILGTLSGDDGFAGYDSLRVMALLETRHAGTAEQAHEDIAAWYGMTMPDMLAPVIVPDPGPQADLGSCTLFRAAVRDSFVRQEQARGTLTAGPPWYVQYARVYRKRTGVVPVREPDFALHRWDGVVDEIMTAAMTAAYEPEHAEAVAGPDGGAEYAGRHETGAEDAA